MLFLSDMKSNVIALIPARCGSQRIKNKNIRNLNGHPLLAYSVRSALASGLFRDVYCITDSKQYLDIAVAYGASAFYLRPHEVSSSSSPDIEWLSWFFSLYDAKNLGVTSFCILRPTSPFRGPIEIISAIELFNENIDVCDSVRAMRPVSEHPGKMWVCDDLSAQPILPYLMSDGTPWHSSQTAVLPRVYIQSAALEVSKVKNVLSLGSLTGRRVTPYLHSGASTHDINVESDWKMAELLAREFDFFWMDT